MICSNCFHTYDNDLEFCPYCGAANASLRPGKGVRRVLLRNDFAADAENTEEPDNLDLTESRDEAAERAENQAAKKENPSKKIFSPEHLPEHLQEESKNVSKESDTKRFTAAEMQALKRKQAEINAETAADSSMLANNMPDSRNYADYAAAAKADNSPAKNLAETEDVIDRNLAELEEDEEQSQSRFWQKRNKSEKTKSRSKPEKSLHFSNGTSGGENIKAHGKNAASAEVDIKTINNASDKTDGNIVGSKTDESSVNTADSHSQARSAENFGTQVKNWYENLALSFKQKNKQLSENRLKGKSKVNGKNKDKGSGNDNIPVKDNAGSSAPEVYANSYAGQHPSNDQPDNSANPYNKNVQDFLAQLSRQKNHNKSRAAKKNEKEDAFPFIEEKLAEAENDPNKRNKKDNGFQRALEWVLIRIRPEHVIALVIVLVLLIIGIVKLATRSPVEKFTKALEEKNYQTAGELYEDYLGNANLENSADLELTGFLEGLKQNAIKGNASFTATHSAIENMKTTKLYQGGARTVIDEALTEVIKLQEIDGYYSTGVEMQEELNYQAAIELFNQVLAAYPGYKDTSERLATIREEYRKQIIRQVGALQSQNNYKEADEILTKALELIPEDPALSNLKETNLTKSASALYKKTAADADRYFQSGNYAELLKTIDAALEQEKQNQALINLKDMYATKCAEAIINSADSIFKQGDQDVDGALAKIDEGLKLMPDNKILQDAKKRYEFDLDDLDDESKPETEDTKETEKDDSDEPETEDKDGFVRGSYEDVAGKKHSNTVKVEHKYTGSSAVVESFTFKNNGKKNSFTGEIALGKISEYTQVYYQVYSSKDLSTPVKAGSIAASPGEAGTAYKLDISENSAGAGYFIVNLNYIRGGEIVVLLDLQYK